MKFYNIFQRLKNIIEFHYKNKTRKFFLKACSSVDRASDSDSESQGFDSLHAYGFWTGADLVSTFKVE